MKGLFVFGYTAICILIAVGQTTKPPPPVQPIPFSHKLHVGQLSLECKTCHTNPDPGERMGIHAPAACMECHSTVGTDNPAIQKLAAFAKNQREIRWARVYEIPAYVRFSHRAHLTAGNTCAECHGQVKEREQLYREVDLSMASCVNCHRAKRASIDCAYCHEQQPQD